MRYYRMLAYGFLELKPADFRKLTMKHFLRMLQAKSDWLAFQNGKDPFETKDSENDKQRLLELAKRRGLIGT